VVWHHLIGWRHLLCGHVGWHVRGWYLERGHVGWRYLERGHVEWRYLQCRHVGRDIGGRYLKRRHVGWRYYVLRQYLIELRGFRTPKRLNP
jgi:hypothetical protein